MRLFIIPSWCPSTETPLSGTFFVEQAEALAKFRPNWKVALCCADLQGSYFPKRPQNWPSFLKRYYTRATLSLDDNGGRLLYYKSFKPYVFFSRKCYKQQCDAMLQMVKPALIDFISCHGKPNILHAHASFPGGAVAVLLGNEFHIPVAITEHMGPFPWPVHLTSDGRIITQMFEAFCETNLLPAVSTSLANRLKELNLPNSRNIKVIPNFIDESIFKPDFSKSKPCPPYNFISVGWPSAEKGTGILLEAFSKLDIPATLTIVGNSPQIDKFKKLADTLKIKDKIVWLGNVPRATMPSLFQSADIFVLPSQYETFGISYLEAIACGKPVIATTCGGPEDFVNSSNGLLVAVDDANDLAFAMHQMATNIHLYDSTIIRNYFLANFSSKIVVDKLDIWYHSGLNTNERTD